MSAGIGPGQLVGQLRRCAGVYQEGTERPCSGRLRCHPCLIDEHEKRAGTSTTRPITQQPQLRMGAHLLLHDVAVEPHSSVRASG